MAHVEISHNELDDARASLGMAERTGRLRWWKPLDREAQLQCEWRNDLGSAVWIAVPVITELKD